jgi:hypothetical protein
MNFATIIHIIIGIDDIIIGIDDITFGLTKGTRLTDTLFSLCFRCTVHTCICVRLICRLIDVHPTV